MVKIGDVLADKYELIEELSSTSSSKVFFAKKKIDDSDVIAKVISDSKQENHGIYENEMRILSNISHPNMVNLQGSGKCPQFRVFYIITDYINGKPFDEYFRIHNNGGLKCCIRAAFQLLEPLELIHQQGFVHKDIKPSNILVEEDGKPYLLDFGISRAVETLTTQSSQYSPIYVSPEEIRREEITVATDIYKLGITLIQSVLDEDDANAFLNQKLSLNDAIEQITGSDVDIANILRQMTAEKVDERYQDIRSLRKPLREWLVHEEKYALVLTNTVKDKAKSGLGCAPYELIERLEQALGECVFAEWKYDSKRGDSLTLTTDRFFMRLKPDASDKYFTVVDYRQGADDRLKQYGVFLEQCTWKIVSSNRDVHNFFNETNELINKLNVLKLETLKEKEREEECKTFLEQANAYQQAEREVFEKKRFEPFQVTVRINRGNSELVCTLKESFQISEEHYKSDESPVAIRKKLEGWGVPNVHDQSVERLLNNFISKRKVYGDWLQPLKEPLQESKFNDISKVELSKAANDDDRQKMAYEILMHLFPDELKRPREDIYLPQQGSEIGFYEYDPSRQKQEHRDSPLLYGTLSKRDPNRSSLTLKYGNKQQDKKVSTGNLGWIAHFSIREETQLNRKEKALKELEDNKGVNEKLLEVLAKVTHLPPRKDSELILENYISNQLDDEQKKAVAKCVLLEKGQFCVLQGPPGTGKTTVITEIVKQILQRSPKAKVLVASQSHQAVDNVLEKVCDDVRVVRLGETEKLTGVAKEYAFDEVAKSMLNNIKRNIQSEDCYLNENELDTIPRQSLEQLEGLRDEWIKRLSGRDEHLESLLFKSVQVVFGTLVGMAGSKYKGVNQMFDYVIVDEAGKAILSELAICMNRGQRIVLVGDHKQLPPVLDEESLSLLEQKMKESLKVTFFEELYTSLAKERPEYCHMLSNNYRMHENICEPVSTLFYEGNLKTPSIVKRDHQLAFKQALYWLNTSKLKDHYEKTEGNGKYYNPCHAELIQSLLERLEQETKQHKSVAIIAPYRESAKFLRKTIQPKSNQWNQLDIEIATVDSFQGSDRDIVILDSVRSNQKKNLGFIADAARLNVALSRAKELLFIIGDADTLYEGHVPKDASNPYRHLIDHIRADKNKYEWVDLRDVRGIKDVQ
jgi:serine/threonine protein kinase/energy-coupling factor transporter ATP-binding protein EcfA2